MENSLLAIFDKILCTTVHGIYKSRNQLKLFTQHENIYTRTKAVLLIEKYLKT